jgi:hypothetical protein
VITSSGDIHVAILKVTSDGAAANTLTPQMSGIALWDDLTLAPMKACSGDEGYFALAIE